MSGSGAGGGSGTTWREQIASAWALMPRGCGAVGFSGPLHPLGGQRDAGQLGEQAAGLANGTAAAARAVILRSPGDIEAAATPSSASLGTMPCPHCPQW